MIDQSVIVLAPLGRDRWVICETLSAAEIPCVVVNTMNELVAAVREQAGAVMLTSEALSSASTADLLTTLGEQPSWSELPILLLLPSDVPEVEQLAPHFSNLASTRKVTVLQRPVPPVTLRTAAQVALRMRRRQYEVRDLLARERKTREELQQAVREREDALHSRDEVLAIVSHDLRSPLSAIDLGAQSLLDEVGDRSHAKRTLEVIRRATDRMAHMIDDLLDMATIDAKGLTLERSIEDAERVLDDTVEAHAAIAAAKGIDLEREGDLRSVVLRCDRDRVDQVFANLIGNAIKYCRRGDTIRVGAFVVGGDVRFTIADTGPGIAAEELPHLFDRYWTVKREGAKKGTGLGLYICKGIIEAHGGTLSVESRLDAGTTFCFTLPRANLATLDARSAAAPI
jgi:signal transduction histidine kinase